MKTIIRKATNEDIGKIEIIYDHIHTATELGETPTGWIRNIYPTKKTAETALDKQELFVAENNGKIVGASIINQEQLEVYKNASWQYQVSETNVMVLHTLVIDPLARGKGVGKDFMKFYEQYALKNNCFYLRLDTNEKNYKARVFYKKLGYSEISILPCNFNGIGDINLVLLEKKLNSL